MTIPTRRSILKTLATLAVVPLAKTGEAVAKVFAEKKSAAYTCECRVPFLCSGLYGEKAYADFLLGAPAPMWMVNAHRLYGTRPYRLHFNGVAPSRLEFPSEGKDCYVSPNFPNLAFGSIVYVNPNYPGNWPEPGKGLDEVPA